MATDPDDESEDGDLVDCDCPVCGGSGGGIDPATGCTFCRGTGLDPYRFDPNRDDSPDDSPDDPDFIE